MALRQAGVLEARSEGKFVFYHLVQPEIILLIQMEAGIVHIDLPVIEPVNLQQQYSFSVETIESTLIREQNS